MIKKRVPAWWGGKAVDLFGFGLQRIAEAIGKVAYAIEYRGRCHNCGDISKRDKFCSKCVPIAPPTEKAKA